MYLTPWVRPLASLGLLLLLTCNQQETTQTTNETTSVATVAAPAVPKFQADSAYAYIAQQLAFGPRVVNTEAHEATRQWLEGSLEAFGAQVMAQHFTATAYTGEVLNATNIIARFSPEKTDRILLCAHWDSRHISDSQLNTGDPSLPVDGADDGGSGVGVLLEVARQLGQSLPPIGIDIVLLDAEDYGEAQSDNVTSWGLGAQHYATNLPPIKPRYGILLDMVGAKNARFTVEEISEYYAPEVRKKVWRLAQQMGYGNYFVEDKTSAVTDDHFFINRLAGIPTIDIINRPADTPTGFGTHWHTDQDNMSVIDKQTIRAVGQLVLAVVYREAAGTL